MFWPIFFYIGLGMIAGFLAGLLGVGGGLIIVPSLAFIFALIHFPAAHLLHISLGTSLACIMFTSVSSFRAHHFHGAVNWEIFKRITPGIFIGTLSGTMIAAHLSAFSLKFFFVLFLFYAATQMLFDIQPKSTRRLPGKGGMFVAGSLIGAVSSLIGIGGGTISIPFMVWCNVRIHEAIGTSAAIGFPIAVAGTIGYVANGLRVADLPPYTWGYLHLPAMLGIVGSSMMMAPYGAKLAHRIPVGRLKKIFAFLLYILGGRMILTLT